MIPSEGLAALKTCLVFEVFPSPGGEGQGGAERGEGKPGVLASLMIPPG